MTIPQQPDQPPEHLAFGTSGFSGSGDTTTEPAPPTKASKTPVIVAAVAALLIGAGVGYGAANVTGSTDPGTVPSSCLNALDSAEALQGDAADFSLIATHMSRVDKILWTAYYHHVNAQVALNTETQGIIDDIEANTAAATSHGHDYARNAKACRAVT